MRRFLIVMGLALSACGAGEGTSQPEAQSAAVSVAGPLEGYVTVERLPTPSSPHLLEGRAVWAGTCQACHGLGEAGSPKITDKDAWGPRIAKGAEALRANAITGFIGPQGTMMPERGGNLDLTDDQVIAAVDFMVANSR